MSGINNFMLWFYDLGPSLAGGGITAFCNIMTRMGFGGLLAPIMLLPMYPRSVGAVAGYVVSAPGDKYCGVLKGSVAASVADMIT